MKNWVTQSIRVKLICMFLILSCIFALVNFFSYYSERTLLNRINTLLTNNIKLKEFSADVDNLVNALEKYLVSRNFDMLREYLHYGQMIEATYLQLTPVEESIDDYLLLENIKNMTRSFLHQADKAVQAKRARNSEEYHQNFMEVVRYNTNIKWAIDRLIIKQLEENSRQYLQISNRLIYLQRLSLYLIVAVLIISITVAIWTSLHLTNPLRKLAEAAEAVSNRDFSIAPLPVSTNDEIAVVTEAFNDMVASITRLFEEIKNQSNLENRLKEQELQNLTMKNTLREAELHSLQSQINPHFLFNTLNAGVQLAIMEDAEKTGEFMDKVASLLRYNLRRIEKPVTLQEEAKNVETYFFILRTRYGAERFSFSVQIEAEAAFCQIPLLTLQPIVENALIHGIENLETKGEIIVNAYRRENRLLIEVSDNGRGMDETTLTRLRTNEKLPGHTTGLGLANVRERSRLFLGESCLIKIQSAQGKGTKVTLDLPAVKEGGVGIEDISC
ncbi:MAG TPA: ATPase [Firmicutes bacterium]|jgi:sensor histidine kinase YesM|nr:ATPase [Bacillota bacterium]HBT17658.1 ATPase [Bacillota bacterium]